MKLYVCNTALSISLSCYCWSASPYHNEHCTYPYKPLMSSFVGILVIVSIDGEHLNYDIIINDCFSYMELLDIDTLGVLDVYCIVRNIFSDCLLP